MIPDDDTPVYSISIAAQLAGMHPQTLRQYDRLGLVSPQRVKGRNRLYSAGDVARLREIAELSADGVSLEGIRRVLEMQAELVHLRRQVRDLMNEKTSTALVLWNPHRRRA